VRRRDKGEGCEDKIAAIGIRVKRWVSLHGVSLNVDPDLGHFGGIVPCGVGEPRFGVTSFLDLGHVVSMAEVDMALRRTFVEVFGPVRVDPLPASGEREQKRAAPHAFSHPTPSAGARTPPRGGDC